MLEVRLAPALLGKLRLGLLSLEGVSVRERDAQLEAEVAGTCTELRERFAGRPSGELPGVLDARALYKNLGIDPTKTRPSNEALLRRALKGEALYRINSLVDALNLASLRSQVPFGLYDLDSIEAPIAMRRGEPGEAYEGIRKGLVNVAGRPVLADTRGPFGNPSSDSARTCIKAATTRALVVAFAPAAYPDGRLDAVLDETQALLCRYAGGALGFRLKLP